MLREGHEQDVPEPEVVHHQDHKGHKDNCFLVLNFVTFVTLVTFVVRRGPSRAKDFDRINLGGAAGGDDTGEDRDREQQRRDGAEADGVVR